MRFTEYYNVFQALQELLEWTQQRSGTAGSTATVGGILA